MKRIMFAMILVPVLFCGCRPNDDDIRRIVREELNSAMHRTVVKPVNVIGPYSPGIRIGRFLFISGQIGLDQQSGALRNESFETEARQALDNLMTILRAEGYDSTTVVSTTIYMKNMNDYAKLNQIYGGYFQEENYPARATVQVGDLPKQADVEISAIAWK